MNTTGWLQLALYLGLLLALVKPLGHYLWRVFEGDQVGFLGRALGPIERLCYRLGGIRPEAGMTWSVYATAVVLFNAAGFFLLYGLLRIQAALPLNPDDLASVAPDGALNIAVSFVTNTNWQWYGGESTLSHLVQMLGLTVQNFLSAATGIAVVIAVTRGLRERQAATLGNFWVDLTRTTLYVLLPLSLVLALVLVSQGVVQNFSPRVAATLWDATVTTDGAVQTTQELAQGPVASQVAIKQLGTNGGGFFNVNSAHPYENPTPLSNLLQLLSILLLPAALCYTFGRMVGDERQGWTLLAAMTVVFVALLLPTAWIEGSGNPLLHALGVEAAGGNMEGKEVRFGVANSALWAIATTAASNGSVNAMHDSFMPLGGLFPMVLMQLGEVIYGGVGSGLYGMLLFVIVAVFVAGLMVGRTPEYLGKKVEAYEMKMASIGILVPPVVTLLATAVALLTPAGPGGMQDGGAHGFSELLYAFSSMGNNNGSAFAGFTAGQPIINMLGAAAMWLARFWVAIPALALAGALAAKKTVAPSAGTLPTHGPLFVVLLVVVVLVVGALTFLPALALGPVVEHLQLLQAAS